MWYNRPLTVFIKEHPGDSRGQRTAVGHNFRIEHSVTTLHLKRFHLRTLPAYQDVGEKVTRQSRRYVPQQGMKRKMLA